MRGPRTVWSRRVGQPVVRGGPDAWANPGPALAPGWSEGVGPVSHVGWTDGSCRGLIRALARSGVGLVRGRGGIGTGDAARIGPYQRMSAGSGRAELTDHSARPRRTYQRTSLERAGPNDGLVQAACRSSR